MANDLIDNANGAILSARPTMENLRVAWNGWSRGIEFLGIALGMGL